MFSLLIGILRNRILWLLVLTACVGLNCQRRPQVAAANDGLMRFALQVGIDEYQHVTALDGCVQDILDMKPVLVNKFGFPEANIQTLTNKQATHEAIVNAFKTHLIENAKKHPNAIVVFQYSGHGSQTDDENGDEGDELDETLVSVDSRDPQGKVFDITDDELNSLFEQLSQHTSNITFILDSCHSGTATRGETKVRRVARDVRPQPSQPPVSRGSSTQTRDGERVDVLPRNERYVTISGSRSTEVSNERRERFALKTNGAMSFHLIRALQRAKPETTYRELMEEVAKAVTLEFPAQHPQFEGDIRRSVFGGSANREDPFIRITSVKGKTITLEAGAAQGIKQGTPIAIYAPDAQRLSGPEKNLAIATVSQVAALTSTAVTPEAVAIPTNAKAVLISPNFGTTKLRVALDPARAGAASGNLITNIREELKLSREIEIVNSPGASGTGRAGSAGWDVALFGGKFGEVFTDKGSIAAPASEEDAALPADDAHVYYLAAGDGLPLFGFFVKNNDSRGPQKIALALDSLARLRALKALSNEARGAGQGIRITPIRVFGKMADDKFLSEREEPLSADQLDFAFDQGEPFKLKVENLTGKDMYIALFDLGTDGSIQILFPPPGAGDLVRSGGQITIPDIFGTTGPAGHETFKVIATSDKRDFQFLTQRAVPRGETIFEKLLNVVVSERTVVGERGTKILKAATVDDWTTSQIDFVISDKKKP